MSKIIAIQLAHPQFPRCVYLVPDEKTVLRFLDNAFVLKGVRWHMFRNLLDPQEYPDLHQEMMASGLPWAAFFSERFPFTMIPFVTLPTPQGNQIKVNDLGRIPSLQRVTQRWFGEPDRVSFTLPAHPASLLVEALPHAQLKVSGELFSTPCVACTQFFDHIAGACTLVHTSTEGTSLCHMSILHRAGLMATHNPGVDSSPNPQHVGD